MAVNVDSARISVRRLSPKAATRKQTTTCKSSHSANLKKELPPWQM